MIIYFSVCHSICTLIPRSSGARGRPRHRPGKAGAGAKKKCRGHAKFPAGELAPPGPGPKRLLAPATPVASTSKLAKVWCITHQKDLSSVVILSKLDPLSSGDETLKGPLRGPLWVSLSFISSPKKLFWISIYRRFFHIFDPRFFFIWRMGDGWWVMNG